MFMTLFAVLLVLWLLGFFAFHVAGGLIHLLLIIAVISLVMHFFRGRSAAWKQCPFLLLPEHPWSRRRRAASGAARDSPANSSIGSENCLGSNSAGGVCER